MSHKKFLPAALSTAALWFLVELLWAKFVMMDVIARDQMSGIPWHNPTTHGLVALVVAALVFGFGFAALFLGGYSGKGPMEGLRFAIWMTLVASVMPNLSLAATLHIGRRAAALSTIGDFFAFAMCAIAAASLAGSAGKASAAGA